MCRISTVFLFVLVAFAFVNGVSAQSKDGAQIYELTKGNFSVKFTEWGASIVSVVVPDNKGKLDDIVLGFDTAEEYKNNTRHFGAIVGRVANRIGGAQFSINGTLYKLTPNSGKNTIHGGKIGFSDVMWTMRKLTQKGHSPSIIFDLISPDGDQGFPGKLSVSITYMLIGENKLSVSMKARSIDKATPVDLSQHSYWNLAGHNSGDILSQTVQIFAPQITEVDKELIPTGKLIPVKDTPYDFLQPHIVGSRINELPNGYDINYAVKGYTEGKVRPVAIVHDGKSGRVMELWDNAPGVQFYTSNRMDVKGKGGFVYKPHAGLCLETQGFPDSVNKPNFPSVIVDAGKIYKHYMLYRFTTK